MDLTTRITKTSRGNVDTMRTDKSLPADTSGINKIFPVDTLLKRFLLREIASYEEPARKGKRRGELIGMRKEKFIAVALYAVTNLPLKDIAKIAAVPYGSLRNWMADDQFINVADGELGAFSVDAMQYLKERVATIQGAMDRGADFYGEIAKEPPMFDDAKFYRENVCRQISWLYFRTFTSAAALIGCPRDLFNRVMGLIFGAQMLIKAASSMIAGDAMSGSARSWNVDRMVERAYLDRVNEFIRLNKKQLRRGGTPDPHFKRLISLYADGEHEYHRGEK